jgi:hypothetical protein
VRGKGEPGTDDPVAMRAEFDRACRAHEDPEACGKLALMAARGIGGPRDDRAGAVAARSGCSDGSGLACVLLGLFLRDGLGVERDVAQSKVAFRRACDLKNADGCRGAREMEEDSPPTPKSSMSASTMTVDGTSFSGLSCDLGGGGGLLGPIAIAKGVSLQKAALDACVKKKTETPLEIGSAGGSFTRVKATGPDPAVNRCVEGALRGKKAAIPGTCTMTVAHGR